MLKVFKQEKSSARGVFGWLKWADEWRIIMQFVHVRKA